MYPVTMSLGNPQKWNFPIPQMCLDSQPLFLTPGLLENFASSFITLVTLRPFFSEDFQTLVPPVLSLLPSHPCLINKTTKTQHLHIPSLHPRNPKANHIHVYTHLRWLTHYFFRASWFGKNPYGAFPQH